MRSRISSNSKTFILGVKHLEANAGICFLAIPSLLHISAADALHRRAMNWPDFTPTVV